MGAKALAPLLDERIAIDHDECRHSMSGYQRAGDDGLPGSGRTDDVAGLVGLELVDRQSLVIAKLDGHLDVEDGGLGIARR